MALNLQVSTDTEVTLPLACDPDVAAANPDVDGTSPLTRYYLTSDPEGLVVPEGASTCTIRALSPEEIRHVESLASADFLDPDGRKVSGRYRASDAAVYARVVQDDSGRPVAYRLDDLNDDEHAGFQRHAAWLRRRNVQVCRRGLRLLSDAPHWRVDDRGHYPADRILMAPNGEDVLEEVASHVLQVSRLPKARPPSSGSSSGARASGLESPQASSAPPATDATGGSLVSQEPPFAAAS